MPYKGKKGSIAIQECKDSSVYSNGEKHQRGKELNTERQRTWGSAGCKYSRAGARNMRGQEHCCAVLYASPSQKLPELLQRK